MGKPDPSKQPVVHKLRGGEIVAWTTDINAYFGRNRHDNVLAACYKVRDADDAGFFAANFIEGEYLGRNNQTCRRYGVTRAGFLAMTNYMYNLADKTVLYLAAFDHKAEELRRREDPPELEPATIPDDPAALEPLGQVEAAQEEQDLPPVDNPVVHADGMRVYATTLDIAAFFQKQHKNVLANVREIEALQPDFYRLNFQPVSYKGRNGEDRPAFEVTKAGFSLAVSGFTGAKALEFRVRYIQRFEEMEAALQAAPDGVRRYGCAEDLLADPHTLLKLAAGYAEKIQTLSNENERLEVQLSVIEPKAAALDRLGDRAGTMNLRSAAKALGFGPDFFNRRLEQLDYLFREDGRLVAYQKHIDAGLFVHKPVLVTRRDGTEYVVSQPLVTAKGLARLAVALGVGVQAVLGQGVLGLTRDDGASDGEALH
jgi:Rha family phage regulatory protein